LLYFIYYPKYKYIIKSCERFEDELDKNSVWANLPNSYFLAFIAYSLILFVEKIAFDSHSLIHHEHEVEGHGHSHGKPEKCISQ
jgi:hypothetical protein